MKKFLLIFGLMILTSTQVFAVCECTDYSNLCAPKPYKICSKGCQITSNITGMTFLAEKIAQNIIRSEIKKATKEKFRVELKSYSIKDLMLGRFKSLRIWGKNLDIDGVYLTSFETKTVCDFNYVELSKDSIKFKENMVMNYALEISNEDLKKTMKSSGYLDRLNRTKLVALGITFFKLDGAEVQIKNNKMYFTINVTSPMSSKPVSIILCADLKVEDGDIVLTKISFVNLYTMIDLTKLTYLLNALNPLTFSTDILNNKNSEMRVQSVNIIDDRIYIKGNVFIPKNAKSEN